LEFTIYITAKLRESDLGVRFITKKKVLEDADSLVLPGYSQDEQVWEIEHCYMDEICNYRLSDLNTVSVLRTKKELQEDHLVPMTDAELVKCEEAISAGYVILDGFVSFNGNQLSWYLWASQFRIATLPPSFEFIRYYNPKIHPKTPHNPFGPDNTQTEPIKLKPFYWVVWYLINPYSMEARTRNPKLVTIRHGIEVPRYGGRDKEPLIKVCGSHNSALRYIKNTLKGKETKDTDIYVVPKLPKF
jgi:hypothetical protein